MNFIYSLIGFPLGWLMWLFYALFCSWMNLPGGYVIALIFFTLLTKVILFPLQIKQQKNSVKQAYYQPQMQAIQKKYANDRQKMQEEMMKFQEKEGIGMGAGCLPMLMQFLVLFGVIDVVYRPLTHILHLDYFWQNNSIVDQVISIANQANGGEAFFRQGYYDQLDIISKVQEYLANPEGASAPMQAVASFLQEQGVLDQIGSFGDSMNFLGLNMGLVPFDFSSGAEFVWCWELLVPVLAGAAALFSSIMTQKLNPVTAQAENQQGGGCMKGMLYGMPLISFFFALTVPAGVGVYWVISNLASLLSTLVVRKIHNPEIYKQQLAEEQAARKAAERKKNTIVVEKTVTDASGNQTRESEEVVLSRKEAERRAIAAARKRMAEKYGDELPSEDAE